MPAGAAATPEELLARVQLFARLPRGELRKLARLCVPRSYETGSLIIEEGSVGLGLFLVTAGRVEVFKGVAGSEVPLGEVEAGDILGELAVLDHEVRSASARALERTSCLLITRDSFQTLLRKEPDVAWCIVPALTERIREMQQRVLEGPAPDDLPARPEPPPVAQKPSPKPATPDVLLRVTRAQYAVAMAGVTAAEGALRMGVTFLRSLASSSRLNAETRVTDVARRLPAGLLDGGRAALREGEKLPERVVAALMDHFSGGRS